MSRFGVSMAGGLAVLGSVLLAGVATFADHENQGNHQGPAFEVTITNLTRGQAFTPILVASHMPGVHLFTLGQPASVELEQLAEAGDTGPLASLLAASPQVRDVQETTGPLPPGGSVKLTVSAGEHFRHLSVAAMLVPTNDGFFALNDVQGPGGERVLTLFSPAYDAGTEANDELCSHIPGPPSVCQGEGFNASRDGAEGYVHIHAGIHGIGDLKAADRDWRNPVAKIEIRSISAQGSSDSKEEVAKAEALQGVWVVSGVPGVQVCPSTDGTSNSLPIGIFLARAVRIEANGTTITALGGHCVSESTFQADQPWGVGTLNGNAVTLQLNGQAACGAGCTIQISQTETLAFHDGELVGNASGTIEGVSGCGAGFPIQQIAGPIVLQRCSSPCGSTCVPFSPPPILSGR